MSMAYLGLTHCEKCGNPLKDNECLICQRCEEEQIKNETSSLSVQRLLDFINNKNNIFGRSLTYPEGWVKTTDLLKLIKEYEH